MTVTVAALVYAMMAWINSTGMIEPAWPEEPIMVHIATHQGVAADIQRCYAMKGHAVHTAELAMEMADTFTGMYCENRVTLMASRVDLEHPAGQAALVHELVHWIQDHNGDAESAACLAQTEYDAYMIHREWQKQMGLTETPDDFTVFMRSQCREQME